MSTSDSGYVYILTNPSFRENYIKIGKTGRSVEERMNELDTTSIPRPFEVFATIKTEKYNEVERLIQKTIDRLSDFRVRPNREFFKIDPFKALDIFKDIALVIDDAVVEENREVIDAMTDEEQTCTYGRHKKSRFKFSICDIQIGEYVTFIPTNIQVKVVTDDSVEFEGGVYKLSPFVRTFIPEDRRTPSEAYQGSKYFSYNGQVLDDIRKAKEAEMDNISTDD